MSWITRCLRVGSDPDQCPSIKEAAELLKQGEVVAFPTETVYGLGGNALSKDAVAKIFEAKQRPADNPLIVHIADASMVSKFSDAKPKHMEELVQAFWPGPLTLVLPANEIAQKTVTCGLNTVALRVPNHPIAQALLREAGMGLAAPSANLSGRPSPTLAKHVLHDLKRFIPLILNGGRCPVGIESTVVDLSQDTPVILRPGTITAEDLEEVLGFRPEMAQGEEAKRRTPGARYRHYAPTMPTYLMMPMVDDYGFKSILQYLSLKGRVAYLGPRRPLSRVVHEPANRSNMGEMLYRILRTWESEGIHYVIVEGVSEKFGGISLLDRLNKAATRTFHNRTDIMNFIESGELP